MPRKPKQKIPLLRRWLTARGRNLEITKSGKLFILLTLAVGFAAINSGSNLLHAVFGAQMAMIIGSGILSEAIVHRIVAHRAPTGTLHAGMRGTLRIDLRNTDPRRDVISVSVEDDDRIEDQGECGPVFATRVRAGTVVSLPAACTMPRRGRMRLPPAVVATRFPFGLFVKRKDLPIPGEILVYPKIHPVDLPRSSLPHIGDGEQSGRPARSGEFLGLREYREGDELRRMHWPAVARLGRPVVRQFEAQGERELMLTLRRGKTGDAGFERHVEDVASTAVAALRAGGVAVGLVYDGDVVVDPSLGRGHEHALLGFLALVGDLA